MTEQSADRRTATEGADVIAAVAGDPEAFRRLTDPYVRELHLHCYRLLGSVHDAEDAVQETLLRAWRYLATFEGRSSWRAWLYRIATNVCLRQGARLRPPAADLPLALAEAVARSTEPTITLSPYPDALLDEIEATASDPVAAYDLWESVQLAFAAAVQLLPPRQRAVLILRDVLGWSAGEVADALAATPASVNSALTRARAALARQRAAGRLPTGRGTPTGEAAWSLVRRYVEAWDAVDLDALAELLTSDVVLTMPPLPLRYSGRAAVADFFATIPAGGALDQFRLLPTRANRQPAVAVYRRDPVGPLDRAWGIFVLGMASEAIADITAFVDPGLAPVFGVPTELAWEVGASERR